MEYNNFTAQTEPEVANQMDKYVEDTFQPLIEPDFDHEYFEKNHTRMEQYTTSTQQQPTTHSNQLIHHTRPHIPQHLL